MRKRSIFEILFLFTIVVVVFFVLGTKEIWAIDCCICRYRSTGGVASCPVRDPGQNCWIFEDPQAGTRCGPVSNCETLADCKQWFETGRGGPAGPFAPTPTPTDQEEPIYKPTPFKSPELQINIPGFKGFTTEESKIKKCTECRDPDILPEDCPPEKCARWVYEIPWIGEYLAAIYKWGVSAVALLAVIMIMINGVRWLMAGGEASKIGEAKKGITYAVTGLIFILLTHQILSLIDPRLTVFKPITIGVIKKIEVDYEPPPPQSLEFVESDLWKFASLAIKNQLSDVSEPLGNFMNCVGGKIKEKTGGKKAVITSISDSAGISNCLTATYKKPPCAHSKNSCHYGGPNCAGKSYALDIWAKGEVSPENIIEAIKICQSKAFVCYTPKTPSCLGHHSHIHTSIGRIYNCGCN